MLISRGSVSESEAAAIIKEVLLAVNYLHTNNIAHRDVRPEHIMFIGSKLDEIRIRGMGALI